MSDRHVEAGSPASAGIPGHGQGRDVAALFDPRSVAVVGASDDPKKWGNWIGRRALLAEHRREVYLVNRKGGQILGRDAWRSLADVPKPVDLVVVAVPASGFEAAVDEALQAGARAIVGISAGLGESGHEGRAREQAIAERVRAAGAVMLGPNCLGVFDAAAELDLTSNGFPGGSIGLISQSGNLALELSLLAGGVGLGFSRFASLGNQADLDVAELVAAFARHAATEIIAIYCEDFRDGRAFAAAAESAVSDGKPVLLLTIGRGQASARAARSHTGALASASAAVDAACRAAGIERVDTPQQLVDVAQALLGRKSPHGRRVAVLSDGGGHGAIAADTAHVSGLTVAAFSSGLAQKLRRQLLATAATTNPIDLAGGGEQDICSFARTARTLLASDEVDAVLMTGYFGGYGEYSEGLAGGEIAVARALAAACAEGAKPLVVQSMYADAPACNLLRRERVPVYRTIESATGALARLVDRAGSPPHGVPTLPAPAPPILDDSYWAARRLVESSGVPFARARCIRTDDEARAAAAEIGFPVVLKALGTSHKSDSGGVAVGIANEVELTRRLCEMRDRLAPPEYSVERMAPIVDGVEILIGARWDPRFGAVALVGMGGVLAELLGDVAVALAPLREETALSLLRSLRGWRVLRGYRGKRPCDVSAAARALVCLADLAAAHPEIGEIEVNPLLVTPDGALGLDARIVLRRVSASGEEGSDVR